MAGRDNPSVKRPRRPEGDRPSRRLRAAGAVPGGQPAPIPEASPLRREVHPIPPLGTPHQPEWSQPRSLYEPAPEPEQAPVADGEPDEPVDQVPERRQRRIRMPQSWLFWGTVGVIFTTGLGTLALSVLLKLPTLPSCPKIFWPTASASLRLYCAELSANKQTVDDLIDAIKLVDSLPANHPLRPEVDRNIELWASELLRLTDELFHQGQFDQAIAAANQIPATTATYQLVADQLTEWRTIWSEAEGIYAETEKAIAANSLQEAFSTAIRLLQVGNRYWETYRFRELNDLITAARLENGKVSRAKVLARRGGVENLLEALELLSAIRPKSPVYKEVQQLVRGYGRRLMVLAERQLDRKDAQEAIAIARKIPVAAGIEDEKQDFVNLALAQSQAWQGTVADLESAMLQAQRLGRDRPLYARAQQLIERWQLEVGDVQRLERAQQLATPGTIGDLVAAVTEARTIPRRNPRGEEAGQLIAQWTAQIQNMEDKPYLDEADRLASQGSVSGLQSAINQARQIRQGRSLYGEAQQRIGEWQAQIQRIQDQPYLDQAQRLAGSGDLQGAIAMAGQVRSGRALSRQAQTNVRNWQQQLDSQAAMQQAYQLANAGTLDALVQAIRTADTIANDLPLRTEADRMINAWSQQVLQLAEQQSTVNVEQAIAIAESIPPRTEAYAAAQLQLQTWRQWLDPAIAQPAPQPSPAVAAPAPTP